MKRLSFAALALAVVAFAAPAQAETVNRELVSIDTCTAKTSTPDSLVMTIGPASTFALATVATISAAPDTPLLDKIAVPLALAMFAGLPLPIRLLHRMRGTHMAFKTVVADKDGYPALTTSDRGNLNDVIKDLYYWSQNRIIAATAATYPACATGTTTSKVKTTNATVALNNGVVNAVAATDDAWTLTGANLLTGFSRKYLLCVSAADAFTVILSDDQAAAANCRFGARPADGITILGILTVVNASGADFVPGTTLLGAAGITASYVDSSDLPFLSKVVLPN